MEQEKNTIEEARRYRKQTIKGKEKESDSTPKNPEISTEKVKAIQTTLTQTNEWIKALKETYDYADDNKAFALLRATLKALRNRIPMDEATHLGSQLPALIRGFFYEGWDPDKAATLERNPYDFLTSVRFHLHGHDDIDLEMAVPEALLLIFERIDRGEAEQVVHALPKDIQELFS